MVEIKTLKKLRLQELIIPKISFYLSILGVGIFILGMFGNYTVIKENNGKMPVWDYNYYSPRNSSEHFTIENISEVKSLQLSDIYHIKGYIWSIGDILMFLGISLLFVAGITTIYNLTLNFLIRRKK